MERLRSPYVQDHYPDDFAYCYGCGRNNGASLGFRTRWDGEETVTEYTPARNTSRSQASSTAASSLP